MRAGLAAGQSRTEREALADLTELRAGFAPDGIWALAAVLEHVARRWLTEYMAAGEQSVGARVTIERSRPFRQVAVLTATATLREIRGNRFLFDVELHDQRGRLVARGSNERAVIALQAIG